MKHPYMGEGIINKRRIVKNKSRKTMSIKEKIIKKDRELTQHEKICHSDFKRRGQDSYNLICRQDVRRVAAYNQLMKSISKEELIEHIQTNFVVYTDYCPAYLTIVNAVEDHVMKCPCAVHWFLETEPICMNSGKDKKDISDIMGDLCDTLHFMKYLSVKDKKDFLEKQVFNLLMLDVNTICFILTPPHFESNLQVMVDAVSAHKIKFLKNISFHNFKSMLEKHITTCVGPCVLNDFGFPICDKSESERCAIDKMNTGFLLMVETDLNWDKQSLFDLSFQPEKYDYFMNYVSMKYLNDVKIQDKFDKIEKRKKN